MYHSSKFKSSYLLFLASPKKYLLLYQNMSDWNGNQKFSTSTHCIFDLDGTLLNTESVYSIVTEGILKRYGYTYDDNLRKKVMGLTGKQMWQVTTKELKIDTPWEDLLAEYRNRSLDLLRTCGLLPGVEKLIRHLSEHKIPISIASSTTVKLYKHKTELHKNLFSLFDHVVCGGSDSEVKSNKPHPDVFLICASRFRNKPSPSKCLVFEDAPNGITAAISAGMQCVAIPNEGLPKQMVNHATLVLNTLKEFKPEEFGLPAFNK